jgi:hypothetical protein
MVTFISSEEAVNYSRKLCAIYLIGYCLNGEEGNLVLVLNTTHCLNGEEGNVVLVLNTTHC